MLSTGLNLAKRQIRSFSSPLSSGALEDGYPDHEKRDSIEESDYLSSPNTSSSYSSRVTSQSYEPMLRQAHSPSPSRNRKPRAYSFLRPRSWGRGIRSLGLCRCSPRAGNRYFTLVILAGLILFILTLSRAGYNSRKAVETGEDMPPPPPPTWEKFPFLKRYHGGIRSLVPKSQNKPEYPNKDGEYVAKEKFGLDGDLDVPESADRKLAKRVPQAQVFDPFPEYSSKEYKETHTSMRECFVGTNLSTPVRAPPVYAYNGVPEGMPDPVMGSHDIFGLRNDVCFDRFGRLGPYGLGYSRKYGGTGAAMEGDREGADVVWSDVSEVDWRKVNWVDDLRKCEESNHYRFKARPKTRTHFFQLMPGNGGPNDEEISYQSPIPEDHTSKMNVDADGNIRISKNEDESKLLPRIAVLIRTWHDFPYNEEHIIYLRSLITELCIQSGAEFSVHLMVHVRDGDAQIWADDEIYQRVLNDSLPAEFRGLGTLWSEPQMSLLYPGMPESNYRDLGVYGVYRSAWMPVMYFAHQHPEYDYFWNMEMDMRYTGHWYELLTKIPEWAKQQPRKGLWERNARFYVPSEHGTWEDFSHMVRVQTEHGTAGKSNLWAGLANNPDVPDEIKDEAAPKPEKPIWGPEPPLDDVLDNSTDIAPPTSMTADKGTWGIGEEADLITFNPLFDPHGTTWLLTDDTTGYNTTRGQPPRRVAINTFSRVSKRLLHRMYRDTLIDRKSMFSEMWPASCALHHGYKAVYAPHPVYIDRAWPTDYLAATFNGGRNGASGGGRLSVFSDERQHNFQGTTWYYDAGFAPNLWKRWLGYRVDNDGGEREEVAGEGRMCLPSLLLHPVKEVDLVFEHEYGEGAAED